MQTQTLTWTAQWDTGWCAEVVVTNHTGWPSGRCETGSGSSGTRLLAREDALVLSHRNLVGSS
jgi:hypothetical protein